MATWQSGDLAGGPVLPSGKPMHYNVLFPDGWTASGPPCRLLVDEHELDQGNVWYYSGQDDLPTRGGADRWYNNASWQAAYGPCIILLPLCDETTDPGGSVQNFGGWSGDGARPVNFLAVLALVKFGLANWNIDPGAVFITGRSLGGIGTWAAMLWANSKNGTVERLFTAGLSLAGVVETYGSGTVPADIVARMQTVPVLAVSGSNDSTSRIRDWNRPYWDAMCQACGAPEQVGQYPAYPGAQAGTSAFHYLEDPALGHDVWDTYMALPKARPLFDWLFAQRSSAPPVPVVPPVHLPASPSGTIVKAGSTDAIIDAEGNAWTITPTAQIAINGAVDPVTQNVVEMAYEAGDIVWQENTSGNWYSKASATAPWSAATRIDPTQPPLPPQPATPGGNFTVRGGQIIDPSGAVFKALGFNIDPSLTSLAGICNGPDCKPLLDQFPHTNMVRIADRKRMSPAQYRDFIAWMTAKKIVVLIEDHSGGPSHPPLSGAALSAELAWYQTIVAAYGANPYVWYGTYNEPGSQLGLAAIWTQQAAIYQTVRAGTANPVVLSLPSGGNPGLVGPGAVGYDGKGPMCSASALQNMTGVIWDLHCYGWASGYSSDPAAIKAWLMGSKPAKPNTGISAAQLWQSADGVVPVIIGEYGNSTPGTTVDPNGTAVCQVVMQSGYGALAWCYNNPAAGDQMVLNGALTYYGGLIASLMASAAPPQQPPPPPLTPPAVVPLKVVQDRLAQLQALVEAFKAQLASLAT